MNTDIPKITVGAIVDFIRPHFKFDVTIVSATVGDILDHYSGDELDSIPDFVRAEKVNRHKFVVDTNAHTLSMYLYV